jgi:hypothetical protein
MNFRGRMIAFISVTTLFLFGVVASVSQEYSQGNPNNPRIEGEVIVVRSWGFDPSSITRPKGKFILIVDNRSGFVDLDLRVDKVAGSHINGAHATDHRQHDWVDIFDLEPGNYQLTEANHPKWLCKITIKPN